VSALIKSEVPALRDAAEYASDVALALYRLTSVVCAMQAAGQDDERVSLSQKADDIIARAHIDLGSLVGTLDELGALPIPR
jgi:hypothetical protein